MAIISRTGAGFKNISGFTLPTVLISSLISIAVLLLAVQVSTIARQSLDSQYYHQLAREAAEAGGVYMGGCIDAGYFNSATIRPNTDCNGSVLSTATSAYIVEKSNIRSTYSG